MYCQQQYPYQMEHPHQQHTAVSAYGLQHMSSYPVPNYVSGATPYSPPSDRPSPPSFRIEDILLQSRNGHLPSYNLPHTNGFSSPSPSSIGHSFSYRLAHGVAHQHEGSIGMPVTMHSCVVSSEKDFQGMIL